MLWKLIHNMSLGLLSWDEEIERGRPRASQWHYCSVLTCLWCPEHLIPNNENHSSRYKLYSQPQDLNHEVPFSSLCFQKSQVHQIFCHRMIGSGISLSSCLFFWCVLDCQAFSLFCSLAPSFPNLGLSMPAGSMLCCLFSVFKLYGFEIDLESITSKLYISTTGSWLNVSEF